MGFSGGGSNVLKNHKHDATVVQDGGSLDADNVTSADLTQGDVIFSDGTHLQRLAIGTPAQQIQVNAGATAPEYFTPAGGGAAYELLGSTELGAPATEQILTWPSESFADVAAIDIYFSCVSPGNANGLQVQYNGLTANYEWDAFNIVGGAITAVNGSGLARVYTTIGSEYFTGHTRVICQDPTNTSGSSPFLTYTGEIWSIGGSGYFQWGGYITGSNISASDGVRIYPPAGNLSTGSVITAYKLNRT